MKYRQSFQYLGWTVAGIFLFLVVLQIPEGFRDTNLLGAFYVIGGLFLVLWLQTKTTYLTFATDDVVYVYAFFFRRKVPTGSIIRIVKGPGTILGDAFGRVTYLVHQSSRGEKVIRLDIGFADEILRPFLAELLSKNPKVQLSPELKALVENKLVQDFARSAFGSHGSRSAQRHLLIGIVGMIAGMILFFTELRFASFFDRGAWSLVYMATLGASLFFGVYSFRR